MSKYIDEYELWERLKTSMVHHIVTNTLFNTIKAVIDGMPTIEIVRCKDCKYSRVYALDSNEEPQRWCVAGIVKAVDDDDYCSWGEMESDEE